MEYGNFNISEKVAIVTGGTGVLGGQSSNLFLPQE